MKIIFSRKGFDSTAGGCPSPIIDGRPLSLPIPSTMPTPTRFGDLRGPYKDLVPDLTRGRYGPQDWCHLDPDIRGNCLPRLLGWRGALGQVCAAQGHLANQNVRPGDLFLFWGLFQPVRQENWWKFVGTPEHRIRGWLQVGDIIDLGADGSHATLNRPWLRDHPHVRPGWSDQNVLYVASDRLLLDASPSELPGAGAFRCGRRLTAAGAPPSLWQAPDWLNPQRGGCGMTYHPFNRWSIDGTVRSAARGQEFIAEPGPELRVSMWLAELMGDAYP